MDAEAALIGRTIAGRYTIERCIGRGGMAAVFAARQEGEPREVAIKIMKRELMKDATVVKRFRREAKAAAMLHHPNTVRVLDYGVDGEDAFIAMELARGKDLFQALAEERPMSQTRSALIVAQVGAALSAAHAQGIVHRDLKPENVMLVPSSDVPGGELVKVLDFGIAKILEAPGDAKPADGAAPQRAETSTNLTRVGTVVGTPAYMSPEQCRGGELDGRSDVYSSGVLLYQLLTGQLPFLGETPLHTAMRHIHAPPRPPSEVRAGLDKALEQIVLKALAKWPAERQQSADQLRQELLDVVDGLPDRDAVLGPRTPRADPRREPGEQATGERGAGVPSPRVIHRQPTEAQVGMRLGGGLGKLVHVGAAAPPPPAPPGPSDPALDDELERSETPSLVADPPVAAARGAGAGAAVAEGAARPPAPRPGGSAPPRAQVGRASLPVATSPSARPAAARGAAGGPAGIVGGLAPGGLAPGGLAPGGLAPGGLAPGVVAVGAAATGAAPEKPRPKWGDDDDERTRLRPDAIRGAQAPPDDDDDDGPRTALMTSDSGSRDARGRVNRTLLMEDESSSASVLTAADRAAAAAAGASIEPSIRSTVRLGSPAPVGLPPGPARKDITAAAFARTQNVAPQAVAAALLDEESKAHGEPVFTSAKATMRLITDEASSPGTSPGIGPGMIAPPLAPPPPPRAADPMRPEPTKDGAAAALRRDGVRGSLEQLPGTTVLVVGVALGVVFSAVVILVIVFLARG